LIQQKQKEELQQEWLLPLAEVLWPDRASNGFAVGTSALELSGIQIPRLSCLPFRPF
jgi:hypothetical protein